MTLAIFRLKRQHWLQDARNLRAQLREAQAGLRIRDNELAIAQQELNDSIERITLLQIESSSFGSELKRAKDALQIFQTESVSTTALLAALAKSEESRSARPSSNGEWGTGKSLMLAPPPPPPRLTSALRSVEQMAGVIQGHELLPALLASLNQVQMQSRVQPADKEDLLQLQGAMHSELDRTLAMCEHVLDDMAACWPQQDDEWRDDNALSLISNALRITASVRLLFDYLLGHFNQRFLLAHISDVILKNMYFCYIRQCL